MSEHTRGPWQTQGWVPTWAYIPVKDAQHNLVCSMYPDSTHGYHRDAVEANARLIAAAPELLTALKALHANCTAADEFMRQAEFVIAKAEGVG